MTAMRIGYNRAAETAMRHYAFHVQKIGDSTVRLASGKKLNKDDPAAVIISSRLQMRIREMEQGMRRNEDMQGELDTAADSLEAERGLLQRMRELALQMNSDTATDFDKNLAFIEYAELAKEFGYSLESRTGMNIVVLDSGSDQEKFLFEKDGKVFDNDKWVDTDEYVKLLGDPIKMSDVLEAPDADVTLEDAQLEEGTIITAPPDADALIASAPSLEKAASAEPAKDRFSGLLDHVNGMLSSNLMASASIGAMMSRLEEGLERLWHSAALATDMLSKTEDIDLAKELVEFVKEKLLAEVSVAIAAQANTLPENVLFLLDATGSTTFTPAAQAVRDA